MDGGGIFSVEKVVDGIRKVPDGVVGKPGDHLSDKLYIRTVYNLTKTGPWRVYP